MHLLALARRLIESAEERALCQHRIGPARCRLPRDHALPHRARSRRPGRILLWDTRGAWSEADGG